jgi:hypothetical protein
MAVYFITIPSLEFVKVGYAADPFVRIKELQTGNPYDLSLLAILPDAGFNKEAELHAKLDARGARQRGEWFWGPAACDLLVNGDDLDLSACRVLHARSSINRQAQRYRTAVEASECSPPKLVKSSVDELRATVVAFRTKAIQRDWRDHLVRWIRAAEKQAPGGVVWSKDLPKICGVAVVEARALIDGGHLPPFELGLSSRTHGWRRKQLLEFLEVARVEALADRMAR